MGGDGRRQVRLHTLDGFVDKGNWGGGAFGGLFEIWAVLADTTVLTLGCEVEI